VYGLVAVKVTWQKKVSVVSNYTMFLAHLTTSTGGSTVGINPSILSHICNWDLSICQHNYH